MTPESQQELQILEGLIDGPFILISTNQDGTLRIRGSHGVKEEDMIDTFADCLEGLIERQHEV